MDVLCYGTIFCCRRVMDSSQNKKPGPCTVHKAVSAVCKKCGKLTGYKCDGDWERATWKKISGVNTCDERCKKFGHRGGSCKDGADDRSTWCPSGQHCHCN